MFLLITRTAVANRQCRIPEEELRSFDDKVIAETNTIARVGILTGAFGANDVRVVDNTWNRIERPSADDPHLRSFILWEPEGPEDFEPTMDKVVRTSLEAPRMLKFLACRYRASFTTLPPWPTSQQNSSSTTTVTATRRR